MKYLFFVFALALSAQAATFDVPIFFSGEDLLKLCKSDLFTDDRYCSGYLVGVFDDMAHQINSERSDTVEICPPHLISSDQLRDIVAQAAAEHPGSLSKPAAELLRQWYVDGFRCFELE